MTRVSDSPNPTSVHRALEVAKSWHRPKSITITLTPRQWVSVLNALKHYSCKTTAILAWQLLMSNQESTSDL